MMNIDAYVNSTLYFEELEEGHEWRSPKRTVTEADIVNFAGISGDFNALHMDELYASRHTFGRRAAHGLLTLAITSGLVTRMPVYRLLDQSRVALAELSCRWKKPVFAGDTLQVILGIGDKKRSKSRNDRGRVQLLRTVVNQYDEVVLQSEWTTVMKLRPGN